MSLTVLPEDELDRPLVVSTTFSVVEAVDELLDLSLSLVLHRIRHPHARCLEVGSERAIDVLPPLVAGIPVLLDVDGEEPLRDLLRAPPLLDPSQHTVDVVLREVLRPAQRRDVLSLA